MFTLSFSLSLIPLHSYYFQSRKRRTQSLFQTRDSKRLSSPINQRRRYFSSSQYSLHDFTKDLKELIQGSLHFLLYKKNKSRTNFESLLTRDKQRRKREHLFLKLRHRRCMSSGSNSGRNEAVSFKYQRLSLLQLKVWEEKNLCLKLVSSSNSVSLSLPSFISPFLLSFGCQISFLADVVFVEDSIIHFINFSFPCKFRWMFVLWRKTASALFSSIPRLFLPSHLTPFSVSCTLFYQTRHRLGWRAQKRCL